MPYLPCLTKILSTHGELDLLSMLVLARNDAMSSVMLDVQGVNNHDLQVRRNFDQFADIAFERNDGMHQPFLTAFSVGSEYDYSKIKEISGKFLVDMKSSVYFECLVK